MSTEYAGSDSFPISITVPDDSDARDAASVAVALEQLRDGEIYLKARIDGGAGFSFTDAIFHGATNFADGSLNATVDSVGIAASGAVAIEGSSVDLMSGKVQVSPSLIVLGDDVNLGASTADGILVVGTFQANHNAIFVAGKTVSMAGALNANGVTTVADLRAVVSNAAGVQLSGAGNIQWRMRELVDADFPAGSGSACPIGSGNDFYYIDTLTVLGAAIWLGTAPAGFVAHISFQDAALAAPVDIMNFDGSVMRLAACSASVNTYSVWLCYGGTAWRRLFP